MESLTAPCYFFGMRALVLVLAACTYMPEPQPPRTVCDGTIVAMNNVASMSSSCEEIPADPCWNDDSEECTEEAERRREHNDGVLRNRVIAAFVVVIVGVATLGYAATN